MSGRLVFTPTVPKTSEGGWGVPLRDIITEAFGTEPTLDESTLPFLRGVKAAADKQLDEQVTELIEAIDHYGSIDCRVEH